MNMDGDGMGDLVSRRRCLKVREAQMRSLLLKRQQCAPPEEVEVLRPHNE